MNRQCHRIVFNRARADYMVVQETARSVSGGCGQTRRRKGGGRRSALSHQPLRLRALAWAILCTWSLGAGLPPAAAQALSIAASTIAPPGQRPIVDAAANGVPVVHIAPPSAAGVSRNAYQDFNVNAQGLILNNSASNVQTQLGGWISANPQLGNVPARLIVNEVVGTGTSTLKGSIEVAGRKADVVIA